VITGPESVGVWTKVSLKDGFEDQLQRALHDTVADTRNLKRSDFAIALRYIHPTIGHGFVPACDEVFPYDLKSGGSPGLFYVCKCLAIDAGRASFSFSRAVSLFEGLDLRNMHDETPEAMRFVRLRLPIYPPP
jgi:hypothetical protein